MISLQIQQIKNPGHFFCKEVDSESSSIENQHFQQLHDEINETFNKEQMVQVPYIPVTGEVCIGLRSSDKKWYRVRNEGIFARKYGQEACCFLVDIGGNAESISVRWLRKSPKKFLRLPFQMKECCLYGVKALTLAIQEDMSLAEKSCLVWDDSATSFMEKCVKRAVSASADILYTDNTGRIHITLYLNNGRETYNFNELLVNNKYAIIDETDGQVPLDCVKNVKSRNKMHLQKLLAQSQIESLSDSETFKGLKISSGAYSDAEDDNKFSKQVKNPGYLSETESRKQERKVVQNHVRLEVSPSKKGTEQVKNQNNSPSCGNSLRLGTRSSLSPKMNTSDSELKVSRTENYRTHVMQNSHSDTESVPSDNSLLVSPLNVGRGRSSSPVNGASPSVSRGRSPPVIASSVSRGNSSMMTSISPSSVSRGNSSMMSSISPSSVSRGNSSMMTSILPSSVSRGNSSMMSSISPSSVSRGNSSMMTSISPSSVSIGNSSMMSSISPSSVSRGNSSMMTSISPSSVSRGNSSMMSSISPSSVSRGNSSMMTSISPSSVSRGNSSMMSSISPSSVSRGKSQLEILKLAMNSKLPSPSQSSASDIDSDSRASPDITRNKSLFDNLRLNGSSIENGGARPKAYISGQFDDSESDSGTCNVKRVMKGISVDGLLRNDPNMSITRGRLPKAAQSKVGMSSGSDTDCSRNFTSRNNFQQPTICSESDTDCAVRPDPMLYNGELSDSSESESTASTLKSPSSTKMTDEEKRRSDMIGKLHGNTLLSLLKPGYNNSGGPFATPKKPVTERMDNLNYVLVHSADQIKPFLKLEDAPIGHLMREYFRKADFPAPRLIQAFAWKSILRGLNFVGLSPPDSGKTFAYLVPIISQLLHQGPYKSLKGAQGPLAVILVPSWRKVQSIYFTTLQLLQEEKRIRVIELYGSEDLKMIPLINGCEILIATPPSLKRVLEHQYVHLNRLCHLIIDDAEVTLINYVDEIQYIVSNYSSELRKQDERIAPQQMMLFGTQWEPVVNSFVRSYMPEPIITITSRYEASLYGKVKQIPVMCKSIQKPNILIEKLDDIASDGCRLIIFASTVNVACYVYQLISSCSWYALLAHDDMDKFEIHEKSSNWHCHEQNGPTILITTDLSLPHLYLSNATTIIHYDLPESKTKFGNRMYCLSQYYWNFHNKDEEQQIEPTSYILISEECTEKIDTISQLLKRSKVKLPIQLEAMLAGRKQEKNSDKEKKLCTYMQAYGKCRSEDTCKFRHLVIPEIDEGSKLTCGYVKVRITNVDDASHLHGIILEHKSPDGTVTDFRCNFTELLFQMASYYGNPINRIKHSNMCLGDLCAYEFSDTFHRVKILDIVKGSIIEADVKFVDDGKEERVPVKQLYDLPQKLKAIPYQTMDLFLCRVRPVDRDHDWTPRASMFMHQLVIHQELDGRIKHKELDGRIVLSMNNTLWLDPLVELIELSAAQTICRKMNVRMELLKNGFAVDNPKHLQDLYEACKGKIRIPDINKELHKSEKALTEDILPESRPYHDVYISAVDLPNLFFVQRKESNKQLEKMMDNLNATMDRADDNIPLTEEELTDCICTAKFPDDDRWYRVKVRCELPDDNVEVFYGDYGDKRTICRQELYQLPQMFTELPFQAIECGLAHVQPRGDDWDEESGDLFWDLTHTVCADKKCIVARIISKGNAEFTGIYRYEVELFDTETTDDINLAQELVWSSLASPKPDSELQELFPVPNMARKMYKSTVQKITDLCGIIYWEKNTERAKATPKHIYVIVEQNVKSAALELIGYKALASIIKLIGRISHPESHQWMLESLFCAAKSKRLREEIIEQECGVGVVKCLEQNCRPNIQEQALIAIDKFLEISQSFISVFGDRTTIEILCQLLDVSERKSTLVEIYRVLSSLCAASSQICEWAHEFDVCKIVQIHLLKTEHQELEDVAMKYLVKLMERNAEQMRREKLVSAVVTVMERSRNEKCILYGTKLCENFCYDNRKHKTVLLECGLAVILTKILNSGQLSRDIRKSCEELHDSLVVKVPHSTSITNRPTGQHHQQYSEGLLPPVCWHQNTFRAIVSVKIKGVHTCDVHFSSKTLDFKTKVDGNLYTFYYELYDEINPCKCLHQIKGIEVKISLRKVEKGKWPRLLKQKQKPSNLSVDYERFVDSSSDSEVSNDDTPFMLIKSKKKQLPKNMKRPTQTKQDVNNDNSSSDSSSGSDDEVVHRTSLDFDPYNPFS